MEDKALEILDRLFLFYGGEIVNKGDDGSINLKTIGGQVKWYPNYANAVYDWLETLIDEDADVWEEEIIFIKSLKDKLVSKTSFFKVSDRKKVAIYGKADTSVATLNDEDTLIWEDLSLYTTR